MADLLFVTPNERGAPRSLAAVSQSLQSRVPAQHSHTELHAGNATRANVDNELLKHDHVFFFGHGLPDALIANGNPVIDAANLTNTQRVVIAMSCWAGMQLGPSVTKHNRSFVGFDAPVLHPRKSIGRANLAYENALGGYLRGNTTGTLVDDLRHELLAAASDYLANAQAYRLSRTEALFAFSALRSTSVGLVCHGNNTATI